MRGKKYRSGEKETEKEEEEDIKGSEIGIP